MVSYVYVYINVQYGIKIGYTSKLNESACYNRVISYARSKKLSERGWAKVHLLPTNDPARLERRLHINLNPYRINVNDQLLEIFKCDKETYLAAVRSAKEYIRKTPLDADPSYPYIRSSQPVITLRHAITYSLDEAIAKYHNYIAYTVNLKSSEAERASALNGFKYVFTRLAAMDKVRFGEKCNCTTASWFVQLVRTPPYTANSEAQ